MSIAIIIPARYGSSRFPGKPLALLNGRTMLSYVVDAARQASAQYENISASAGPCQVAVATEDARIASHAEKLGVCALMTGKECHSGTDRVRQAALALDQNPDFIVNLQGDAPFTSPAVIMSLIEAYLTAPLTESQDRDIEIVTPCINLSWRELDLLRRNKKTVPFSGTTVVFGKDFRALWFSKNIIPAIREEKKRREEAALGAEDKSPVWQHIGLYGYRRDILERVAGEKPGKYEKLEGLEQLRFLENGYKITCVPAMGEEGLAQGGIDSPQDLARAEALLRNGAAY